MLYNIHRNAGKALVILCLAGAGLSLARPVLAATAAAASAEEVQAAYLHRFLNYVEWPPGALARADAPYVIGVAGDARVADELARIAAGRNISHRGIIVKRMSRGDVLDGIHMLFIGDSEHARMALWLRMAKGRPIVTVTTSDSGLDLGSTINFRTIDNRIRFELAVNAAEQSGIRLNSRLFSVAVNIVKGSR